MSSTKKHEKDRDFIGRGILTCRICGEKVIEHRIGRCPMADDVSMFYGQDGRIRRTKVELEEGTWTPEPS
jgi:hypothetical protein